jgi:hypothetical protein
LRILARSAETSPSDSRSPIPHPSLLETADVMALNLSLGVRSRISFLVQPG